jgi:hypothetical protein
VAVIFEYLNPKKQISIQVLSKRIYRIMELTMHEVPGRQVNPYRIYFTKKRDKLPFYATEIIEWPNWL